MSNRSVVQILGFKGVQEGGITRLDQLFAEGYAAAKENKFPAHSYFRSRLEDIMKSEGIIDAWLVAICLTTFAQGIAVGRGTEVIEDRDVETARLSLCGQWPDCQMMRLQGFVDALEEMIRQPR